MTLHPISVVFTPLTPQPHPLPFIASLHHDHKQLWAVSPCGASTDLPDLIVPAVGPLQRVPKVKVFWSLCPFLYCEHDLELRLSAGSSISHRVGGWDSRPSTVEGGAVGLGRMCKLEAWDCCGRAVGAKYVGLG